MRNETSHLKSLKHWGMMIKNHVTYETNEKAAHENEGEDPI